MKAVEQERIKRRQMPIIRTPPAPSTYTIVYRSKAFVPSDPNTIYDCKRGEEPILIVRRLGEKPSRELQVWNEQDFVPPVLAPVLDAPV